MTTSTSTCAVVGCANGRRNAARRTSPGRFGVWIERFFRSRRLYRRGISGNPESTQLIGESCKSYRLEDTRDVVNTRSEHEPLFFVSMGTPIPVNSLPGHCPLANPQNGLRRRHRRRLELAKICHGIPFCATREFGVRWSELRVWREFYPENHGVLGAHPWTLGTATPK